MRRFLICTDGFSDIDSYQSGCWVNVESPTDDDLRFLAEELNVPRQMLLYTSDIDERSRIEIDGEWILTILRIPAKSNDPDEPINTVPIGIITKNDLIITVCPVHTELIRDFIADNRNHPDIIESKSKFILKILYASAYWYLNYLKIISNEVSLAEAELQRSVRNSDLLQLMKLQKTLVYFSTSLRGNEVLISRLRHIFTDDFDIDLLEDVEIELKQALSTVQIYTEILGGTLDTYASVISNNVNEIMKRMTGTTIVLMIPTLIASFYGMNLDISISNIPGAFWMVVSFTAILTFAVYVLLRKIRWF